MSTSLPISQRVQALQPSATIAMATKAKELKAAGQTVYDFSLGEPDFDTPEHIREAAAQAMQAGHTHYTPAAGIPQLRAAVANDYTNRHQVSYSPEQVVVSNGAKHALHNVFTVVLEPGDEVIIPAPYWVSYSEMVKLTGAVPVIVPSGIEENFKISPEKLEDAITNKTKMLLLCSPSNPTGSVYSREELAALLEIAAQHNLAIVSDEIYEHLVYDHKAFVSVPAIDEKLVSRTIVVNGVSKAYAMTGWRIGWTLAPPEISKAIGKVQGQQTSNPCSVSQHAALAALEGSQDCVAAMRAEFAKRRAWVRERIEKLPGVTCPAMDGAFYAFVEISPCLGKNYEGTQVTNSSEFCLTLLEQKQVATVMGSAFGAEGYVRISYATSMEVLQAGFDRIEAFLNSAS